MSNIARLVSTLLILIAVALAAALAQPEWACDLGLDPSIEPVWTYWGLWHQKLVLEPGQRVEAINQRCHAKERLSIDVFDGRLTLFEAAALFRYLNRENLVLPMIAGCPGNSEEELYCWQVIDYVARLQSCRGFSSADERRISGRLKEELRRHKEQHGHIVLPDANLVLKAVPAIDQQKQDATLSSLRTTGGK